MLCFSQSQGNVQTSGAQLKLEWVGDAHSQYTHTCTGKMACLTRNLLHACTSMHYPYISFNYCNFFLAHAVYTCFPSAFEALASFKLLQLPSVATMKSYIHSNRESPGDSLQWLAHECSLYDTRVQEHGDKPLPPLGDGMLIANEVKVVSKLPWNSNDDSVIGHYMIPEELSMLQDLYAELDDVTLSKTTYVLQTFWRNHSTDHDIVGPYYTSAGKLAWLFLNIYYLQEHACVHVSWMVIAIIAYYWFLTQTGPLDNP